MHAVELPDVEVFLERTGPLLLADEARHNLALGIASTLQAAPDYYPVARFWVAVDAGDVVGACLRTPPHNLLITRPLRADALPAFAETIDDAPPGVTGALPEVEELAAAWVAARGGSYELGMAMRIHALQAVRDRGDASGAMRSGADGDRDLAIAWWRAFAAEAMTESRAELDGAAQAVDHRLRGGDAGIALWEDGGEVVSLAGFGGPTPNGVRIGPVYTPPELRGRGYATSLVAALSQRLLDGGRRFCFLYTDLANPTSNRIYARIGYEQVCDSAEIALVP
jgi:uncharacterized protein